MSSRLSVISKTDYMRYVECPLYAWLAKHKPELMKEKDKLIFHQGQEVEAVAHGLFEKGVEVKTYYDSGSKETQELITKGAQVIYQAQAMTDKFLARADILVKKRDGWHLYEVKSSSDFKKHKTKYIHDLQFQVNVFNLSGIEIKAAYLIHLNREYVYRANKGLELNKLFIVEDMTDEIMAGLDDELKEMDRAYEIIIGDKKPEVKAWKKSFEYELPPLMYEEYYKGLPDYSIYDLSGRFGQEKINELVEQGILLLKDIPISEKMHVDQIRQIELTKKQSVEVNKEVIAESLEKYKYPLYYLDYETISSPLPLFDGTRPWQQIPMQYSLHVQDEPGGEVRHYEYLHISKSSPFEPIAKFLREQIGDTGTVIAWHDVFEKGRNKEIGEVVPRYAEFMADVNRRMKDLKLIFKEGYVDYRFKGSASLKAVLPVLFPKLSYVDLEVQGGGEAMEAIYDLVFGEVKNKEEVKKQLLEYCERDTFAMVELYNFLRKQV